jgi:EpsD family peptidyl-prolyl cis-trans isomerase
MNLAPGPSKFKAARLTLTITLVAAASLLVACGGEKKKGATQVAAKVNKEEISVHQINFVLQRTPNLRPEQAPEASKRILEGLIDQELAVQQATEQKLDRDPNVVMAVEAAKRDILARAYADKIANTVAKPTDAEIADYYVKHPGLFSQRRVYTLQEFGVEADDAQKAALQAKLQGVTSAAQAAAALTAANAKFASREITQTPENMPLGVVDKLAALNVGQFLVNPAPKGFGLVFVNAAKPAPVTQEQAKQAIENFLTNDRKRTTVAENMKHLRQEAKIEYTGQFTGPAPAASAAAQAPAPASAAASSDLDASSLQKGLSGLK